MDNRGQLTKLPFDIIKSSDIISKDDLLVISDMADELKEVFLKTQQFRTRTEMEISVLNDLKFPTPASKYWQAVKEQNVMFGELVNMSYDYRKNLIEIKKLVRSIKEEKDEFEVELLKIEVEERTYHSRQHERIAKARIIELKHWSEIKIREAKKMSKEELENCSNHQLVSYTERWSKQAEVMGDSGSPSERQNLYGQLSSGIKGCKEKGLLEAREVKEIE